MITAKNYAAQAKKVFENHSYKILDSYVPKDVLRIFSAEVDSLIAECIDGQHFVIPDGGVILDPALKGLSNQIFPNLPYPAITVEFFYHSEIYEKIVVFASQQTASDDILITTMVFLAQHSQWVYIPCITKITNGSFFTDTTRIFTRTITPYVKNDSAKNGSDAILLVGLSGLCQLLQALSCRNVSTAIYQAASPVNARRINSGKTPILETKMLVINSNATLSGTSNGGGPHGTHRQHLRRGHIRRLESGNIWVNSCVVGDAAKGKISKTYAVI